MELKYVCILVLAGLIAGCGESDSKPVASTTQPAETQAGERPRARFRPTPEGSGRMLEALVVEKETGLPLEYSKITVFVNDQKTNTTTDADGIYVIHLPDSGLKSLKFHSRADGYVPTIKYWSGNGGELVDLPEEFTLAVEKGTTLSGVLRDDAGNPVVGVGVMLYPENFYGPPGEYLNYVHHSFKTDATGRWTCDIAPADPPLPLTFYLYPSPQGYVRSNSLYEGVSLEAFREGTAVDVLRRLPTPPQ